MAGIIDVLKSVDTIYYIWTAAILIFAILEAVTVQLVSIWFVIGSVAGLICAIFKTPVYVQVIAFIAVSIIALLVTRPLVKKRLKPKVVATNADRVIGKKATVYEVNENSNGVGLVKVDGQCWSCRTQNNEILTPGDEVEVIKIEGAKLIVKK